MKKFFMFILMIIAVPAGSFYWFDNNNHVTEGEVRIFEGATVKQVSSILEKSGIIPNGDLFYLYARGKLYYYNQIKKQPDIFKVNFKHGRYRVQTGDFDSLITQLNKGTNENHNVVKVTIPEGVTLDDMAAIFDSSGLLSKKQFLNVVSAPEVYNKFKETYQWMPELHDKRVAFEGLLHANTYEFSSSASAEDVINVMLKYTDNLYDIYQEKKDDLQYNLTFFDVLTLASVVEKESKFKDDRPKVAQVFLNRLHRGMKLESDITAAYANGEHKVFMLYEDIETASPYNTYHISGLPIGPINSPSKQSFLSVLEPEGEDFDKLYFYARPNGETFYAETWKEHDRNRAKWEHEWLELND